MEDIQLRDVVRMREVGLRMSLAGQLKGLAIQAEGVSGLLASLVRTAGGMTVEEFEEAGEEVWMKVTEMTKTAPEGALVVAGVLIKISETVMEVLGRREGSPNGEG